MLKFTNGLGYLAASPFRRLFGLQACAIEDHLRLARYSNFDARNL